MHLLLIGDANMQTMRNYAAISSPLHQRFAAHFRSGWVVGNWGRDAEYIQAPELIEKYRTSLPFAFDAWALTCLGLVAFVANLAWLPFSGPSPSRSRRPSAKSARQAAPRLCQQARGMPSAHNYSCGAKLKGAFMTHTGLVLGVIMWAAIH